MKNKDNESLFKAIRDKNLSQVIELVSKDKDYLLAKSLSSKDEGQTGLQVALKTEAFDIAQYLIEEGADVNFISQPTKGEKWALPVLHSSIKASIFNTHTLKKDATNFDKAFSIFKLMLSKKADINVIDSFGNNCLTRALLDASQMIDHPAFDVSSETISQIKLVIKHLIDAGANVTESNLEDIKNFELEKYQLFKKD